MQISLAFEQINDDDDFELKIIVDRSMHERANNYDDDDYDDDDAYLKCHFNKNSFFSLSRAVIDFPSLKL